MGNGQSGPPPPRAVNKLSKPKTNSWKKLTGPKFWPRSRFDSQFNTIRYSLRTRKATVCETGEEEDIGGAPARSFRPKSSHGEILQVNVNGNVESYDGLSVGNSPVVKVEVDQPNSPIRGAVSTKRPPARPARLSLQNLPLSPRKRLSFVGETSCAQPSSAKQLRFTGIWDDNKHRRSGSLQRARSDTNLYSPSRRRSFLQHGIATRNVDTDPLRWFRKSSNSRNNAQNCRSSLASPTSNSLLNVPPSAPRLEFDSLCPRAVTPSGSDYGHIGAFKLGSLRITNGVASPAPSDMPASVCDDEEYVSASEGRPSMSNDEDMTTFDNDESWDMVINAWKESSQSPPHQGASDVEILKHEKQNVSAASPQPISIETHLPPQEFSLFKFTDSPSRPQTPSNQLVSDDAMSPLSLEDSPPMSPNFEIQATSKHMAAEDDLFEPEPQTQRQSIFRIHGSFDSAYQDSETPVTVKINHPQDLELRLLSKSDSGYSSNMSLRSCVSTPTVVSATQLPSPSKARISMSDMRAYSSESTTLNGKIASPEEPHPGANSIGNTISKASAISYSKVRPRRLVSSSLQRSNTRRPTSRQPPPLSYKYSCPMTREGVPRPLSRISSGQTSRVESTDSSGLPNTGIFATPNTTSRWRSKSKAREPPQPVFTTRASPTLSEQLNVPPVPKDASRRLEQRTKGYSEARPPNCWTKGASASMSASLNEPLGRPAREGSMEFGDELPSVPVNTPIEHGSSAASSVNRKTFHRIPASQGKMSIDSDDYLIRHSSRRESPGYWKRKFSGLGIQGISYHNRSQSNVPSERGRPTSREVRPLHSFERNVPSRHQSLDFGPRCPSCGPSPQKHEWHSHRSNSMVSQYPWHKTPAVNANRNSTAIRGRDKSLPPLPISASTQDRIEASHMALHSVIPPIMTLPFPRSEDRSPTKHVRSGSRTSRNFFWPSRKSSRAQSTRPSMDFHHQQPHASNYRMSYDMRPQEMNYGQRAYDPRSQEWAQEGESYDTGFTDMQWEEQDPCEEPHGTYYYSKENKLSHAGQREVDCGSNEERLYQPVSEAAHWRGTPAANVLEPDGFTGEMANGYEAENWSMRSAQAKRSRRGLRESHVWGAAMNAVPVFLQKVKITKS